ncbi:MAG: RNA methyltransferase [Lachnospiraceae bacterium]|nr:RNA methyltransferase [Lachnospiraceae bacterium]
MITSASNGKIKWVCTLREKAKLRRKEQKFIAEGCKMFLEAPPERLSEVYVSESFLKKEGELETACKERLKKISYEVVSDDVYKKMSDTVTPQGILCVIAIKEASLQDMLKTTNKPLFVLLENLQDPGNLGTIMRTAEGAGVTGVILSKDCVDIYNPKVIRSTMGSIYRVPHFYAEDLCGIIEQIKEKGINVYAAALDSSEIYDTYSYKEASAFLIGNEGNGLKPETIAAAGKCCYLPMEGQVESLNASVAASILMYEAYRQRRIN